MKSIKLLMVACLLGIASTVSAQFVNSNNSSMSNGSADATEWQGLRVSYHPVSINADGGGSINFSGASVGYIKSFGISGTTPVFLETGANISWFGGDLESWDDDEELKLNVFSINVPFNLGYKFMLNETTGIFPYAGLTLRGNIVGNYSGEGESVSAFGDDVSEGYKLKRFQIGWQIGVGVNFNTFFVGASYGTDFNEVVKGGKVAMPSITIGFNM